MIEKNYPAAAHACYHYIKTDFDINTNLGKYVDVIVNTRPMDFENVEIPQPSWLRRILFYRFV
jgi:hypothetical protein